MPNLRHIDLVICVVSADPLGVDDAGDCAKLSHIRGTPPTCLADVVEPSVALSARPRGPHCHCGPVTRSRVPKMRQARRPPSRRTEQQILVVTLSNRLVSRVRARSTILRLSPIELFASDLSADQAGEVQNSVLGAACIYLSRSWSSGSSAHYFDRDLIPIDRHVFEVLCRRSTWASKTRSQTKERDAA
jgi:hypothetical protein